MTQVEVERRCPVCSTWGGHRDATRAGDAEREALLRALGVIDEARGRLDVLEAELLDAARRSGTPWREIAAALGLSTPQAACQRASRHRQRGTPSAGVA